MYKKILVWSVIGLLVLAGTTIARADGPDLGFPWDKHAGKFNFLFGNLIDNHQQTRLLKNGQLQGYIYIQFTDETIDGIPVARRANCDDPRLDCRVGWEIKGVPIQDACLLQKGPRIWRIAEDALPSDPEFVHFHWKGTPKKPCGLELDKEPYDGYLFKRTAVTTFYWLGGNDDKESGRLVTPGIDLHSNLEGRWTGGGGHDGGHTGEDPGGDNGGCGGHDTGEDPGGDTGGCGGHDTGEDPDGDTGGCGGHDTCEDPGGEPGGPGGETGGCGSETGGSCEGH